MSIARILGVVVVVACWATSARAQCAATTAPACAIDLHGEDAPRLSKSCTGEAWKGHLGLDLPERFADGNKDGWHEVVLDLRLDPVHGCGCVVFRIDYGTELDGVNVNIGDSPTNDGYGGDAWSTVFDAEILIGSTHLSAFATEQAGSPAELQLFGISDMPIAGETLELEVCDQSVRFAVDPDDVDGLRGFFTTYRSRELISIRPVPDGVDAAQAPDARIHASFNRVIHHRTGRPSHDRYGTGVRRVEIQLTP
jgi:hypothetical protein